MWYRGVKVTTFSPNTNLDIAQNSGDTLARHETQDLFYLAPITRPVSVHNKISSIVFNSRGQVSREAGFSKTVAAGQITS